MICTLRLVSKYAKEADNYEGARKYNVSNSGHGKRTHFTNGV
jgi:hypothetical protein